MKEEAIPPEFKAQLLGELKKSGFASEMEVIRLLISTGWKAVGSSSYFDLDKGISRNIDACAIVEESIKGVDLDYRLFIEVKKGEKPWIVFRAAERMKTEMFQRPHVISGLSIKRLPQFEYIETDARLQNEWVGHAVHEAFKEPNDSGRWYVSATTVAKAAYSHSKSVSDKFEAPESLGMKTVTLTHPVVVFDGELITAHINDSGETMLERVAHAPMQFEFGTTAYESQQYRIDLVTLAGLESFLKTIRRRVDALTKCLEFRPS